MLDVFSGSTRGSGCTIHARSARGAVRRFEQYGIAAQPAGAGRGDRLRARRGGADHRAPGRRRVADGPAAPLLHVDRRGHRTRGGPRERPPSCGALDHSGRLVPRHALSTSRRSGWPARAGTGTCTAGCPRRRSMGTAADGARRRSAWRASARSARSSSLGRGRLRPHDQSRPGRAGSANSLHRSRPRSSARRFALVVVGVGGGGPGGCIGGIRRRPGVAQIEARTPGGTRRASGRWPRGASSSATCCPPITASSARSSRRRDLSRPRSVPKLCG